MLCQVVRAIFCGGKLPAKVQSFICPSGTSRTPSPTVGQSTSHVFVSAPVSFRRSRVPPPYWVFVGWPHTIKCSVGNGLDRSEGLFYMPFEKNIWLGSGTVKTVPHKSPYHLHRPLKPPPTRRGAHCAPAALPSAPLAGKPLTIPTNSRPSNHHTSHQKAPVSSCSTPQNVVFYPQQSFYCVLIIQNIFHYFY